MRLFGKLFNHPQQDAPPHHIRLLEPRWVEPEQEADMSPEAGSTTVSRDRCRSHRPSCNPPASQNRGREEPRPLLLMKTQEMTTGTGSRSLALHLTTFANRRTVCPHPEKQERFRNVRRARLREHRGWWQSRCRCHNTFFDRPRPSGQADLEP